MTHIICTICGIAIGLAGPTLVSAAWAAWRRGRGNRRRVPQYLG